MPVSQRAFPYGGIELARLYDARQEVAANIGGRPPAAFGLLVHDGVGASRPRDTDTEDDACRAERPPSGSRGRRPASASDRARRDESPTRDRSPTCAPPAPGRPATLRARTSHRFTAEFIETSWSLHRRAGHGRYTVAVRFPSWGAGATIEAVLRDGSRIAVGSERLPLGEIDHFLVRSEFSGYVVELRDQPANGTARSARPAAQSSAPDPGPTLVVELARNSRLSSARADRPADASRG